MSQERLMSVLLGPHVSEKSARIAETANQFVFRVRPDATSPEIKAAVEALFNRKVANVNTIVAKGKSKRWQGRPYQRSDFKKAIVTLAEGEDPIDITEGVRG